MLITLVSRLGYDARLYRAMFLEELSRDYVRTARAKGLSEQVVLFKHVLRNAMIPVITNVFTIFPILFLGSVVFESFFGIPGLGSYTIEAIGQQDFAVVQGDGVPRRDPLRSGLRAGRRGVHHRGSAGEAGLIASRTLHLFFVVPAQAGTQCCPCVHHV